MDKYTLETDGSYLSTVNICGIGGVLYKNGEIIDCYALASDVSPLEHESLSILYGLLLAKKHGAQDLNIKTDSLSHVMVFKAKGAASFEKNNYNSKSLHLLNEFKQVSIKHRPREENRTADKLSTLYKHNGYVSVSEPIDTSDVLEANTFISRKKSFAEHPYQVTMFDISTNSADPKNPNEGAYLNSISYDNARNTIEIQAQKSPNNLSTIIEMMYEQIKEKNKQHSLVFNGERSNMIRQKLATYRDVTKNLHSAFLSLSASVENEPAISLAKEQKKKAVKKPKVKSQNIGKSSSAVSNQLEQLDPQEYYVYIKASTEKKQGSQKKKQLVCEACFINKQTKEVFYRTQHGEITLLDYVKSLGSILNRPETKYTLELEGEFASALNNFYTGGIVADSTKEKLKKLEHIELSLVSSHEEDKSFKSQAIHIIHTKGKNIAIMPNFATVSSKSVVKAPAQSIEIDKHDEITPEPQKLGHFAYFISLAKSHIESFKKTTSSWKKRFQF